MKEENTNYPLIAIVYREEYINLVRTLQRKFSNMRTEDVEDAIDEAFLRALMHNNVFEKQHLVHWVHRVALNILIDTRRHGQKLISIDSGGVEDALPTLGDFSDCKACISMIVERLDERKRKLLEMKYEGCKHSEISVNLKMPINLVSVQIHRLRRKIRKCYCEHCKRY